MNLGLIGMAGAGKSYWGRRLARAGFRCLHCDDLIAARLSRELGQPLRTLREVGDWMGLPYEDGYAEREQKYLLYERLELQRIGALLAGQAEPAARFVVDMTGSAIYAGEEILADLRRHLTFVYFAVSPEVHERMLHGYLADPRPIVWQGLFEQRPDESPAAALAHCYPRLIAAREQRYEAICDVKLDFHVHRRPGLTIQDFLQLVGSAGEQAGRRGVKG